MQKPKCVMVSGPVLLEITWATFLVFHRALSVVLELLGLHPVFREHMVVGLNLGWVYDKHVS